MRHRREVDAPHSVTARVVVADLDRDEPGNEQDEDGKPQRPRAADPARTLSVERARSLSFIIRARARAG